MLRSILEHHRQFSISIQALRGNPEHKKVPVQLLKDFPGLGFKGEIVTVATGRMRNELHRGNGAAYVIKGEPLRIPLVSREKVLERQRREAEQRKAVEAASLEAQLVQEQARATGRLNAQSEMLNALENLTNLNFNLGADAAAAAAASKPAADSNLFFLESAIKSLPPLVPFPVAAQATGFISPVVSAKDVASKLQALIDDVVLDPSSISFKVLVDRGSTVDSSVIDFVGTYTTTIKLSEDRIITKKLRVFPRDAPQGWEELRRPFGHPLPATPLADATAATEPVAPKASAEAAEPAAASETARPAEPTKKAFEWENDFIANMKK